MEAEMIVSKDTLNIPSDTDQICKLIDTLYHSQNTTEQAAADRKLIELQSSDQAWHICWPLLDLNKISSVEVHFFAANMLVSKINQSWSGQDEEWLQNHLRPKLFETLVGYSSSPNGDKLVVERLSLALATFALHSIPTFWPDAIEDILKTFTPANLPVTITPQRICDILLKILKYIPEEYDVSMPQQDHRAKLNQQMTKSGPIVFRFLHSLLNVDNNVINTDCKQNVLKCLTSWTMHSRTSLLEMDNGLAIIDALYRLIADDELCSLACATLAATFSSQKAENYRLSVIDFIPKIAQLEPVIKNYMANDEIECAIKTYALVINFSENHSRLLLRIVLGDGVQLDQDKSEMTKQAIFTIIRIIMDCTSAPGTFGIDERYSDISFPFWFAFFENFYYYSDSFIDIICTTFNPLVDSLLQILITKSHYPSSITYRQEWNDDQRESYRCYRQDLGDNISLIVHFPRSRERILAKLHDQLTQEFNIMMHSATTDEEMRWQGFESVLFALKSLSDAIPFDEAKYVPKIFAILSHVPFSESQPLLYCTAAEMISAYSDWLFTHNTHLAVAFNILFLGVKSSDPNVRLMSTLSLKDITSECQSVLQPFAPQIVKSCTDAVLQTSFNLSTNEKSRLMHTIGTTLAMLPPDSIASFLDILAAPLVLQLSNKAQLDSSTDPTCRPIILERLVMLNSLIESLYIKQFSGNEYEVDVDENDHKVFETLTFNSTPDQNGTTLQPALGLLKQLVPILSLISIQYRSDEQIVGAISNTVKRSAKSLGVELKPLLKDLLTIVVNTYDPIFNSNMLEGCLPLYLIFRVDQSTHELLRDAFGRISDKTLEVCVGTPIRQLSLTMENYFKFATFVCKKFPDFLTVQTPNINVEYILKLAVACLELPEKRTLAEVCGFLSLLRQKSVGVDYLHKILVINLDMMLANIFNIFGGTYSTPRNAIEHVTDLLFVIKDADEAKQTFKSIVERKDFPTSFASQEQKVRFVSKIVHEKNRKKFKEACSEFVLIVRNLNRSM